MTNEKNLTGPQKIMDRITKNNRGIHISRIPEKVRTEFIKLANDEFCGDYGTVLTFLMRGLVSHESQMILDGMDNLDKRVNDLEMSLNAGSNESDKSIKLANGREINKK